MNKRIAIAIMTALLCGGAVNAQDFNRGNQRPSKEEMTQHRTDRMVKEYGLDSKQAKQLLELNKEYADKMMPMGGPRGGFNGGPHEKSGQKPPQKPSDSHKPGMGKGPHGKLSEADMAQMMKAREAYQAELSKIMTAEQFSKYQADEQKRMQNRPHGPRKDKQEK